jgi:hypothetical protein
MSGGGGGLDLRYPIGGLFAALGVLLAAFGGATASDTEMYVKSGGMNINLVWGVVLLVTGVIFLLLARAGSRADAAGR